MSHTSKNRVAWIDAARAIALFLVVLTHLPTEPIFYAWVYTFHIPAFFFLSGVLGALAPDRTVWGSLQKNARRLLLPYYTIGVGMICLATFFFWLYPNFSFESFFVGLVLFHPTTIAGALWFLPALFFVRLYWDLLRRVNRSTFFIACGCVIAALVSWWLRDSIGRYALVTGVSIVLNGAVFYGAGLLWPQQRTERVLSVSARISFLIIIMTTSIVSSLVLLFQLGKAPNVAGNIIGNEWVYYGAAFAGTMMVVFLGKMLARSPQLQWIGQRTLPIFAWHLTIIWPLRPVFSGFADASLLVRFSAATATSFVVLWLFGWLHDSMPRAKQWLLSTTIDTSPKQGDKKRG